VLGSALLATPLFWIPALILLIIGGLVILYFKWKAFRDLVNETATWFWKNWQWAGLLFAVLIPGLGPVIYFTGIIIKNWTTVKNIFNDIVNILREMWNWFSRITGITGGKVKNFAHGIATNLLNTAANMLGLGPIISGAHWAGRAFQAGGVMGSTGFALVGEHGPEVVHLPMGSRVQPIPAAAGMFDAQTVGGVGNQPIVIQLVLNRKVLEEAVVDLQNRRSARA